MEEKKIKEDVDVAKEEEGEVIEEEEVETILVEQMKGGMINLMLNVIITINMVIFLRSVEPMLKKRPILLVKNKKVKSLLLALNKENDDKSL
ncbi:hypothetical protein CR513_32026, partial [Mucuna pruriens]